MLCLWHDPQLCFALSLLALRFAFPDFAVPDFAPFGAHPDQNMWTHLQQVSIVFSHAPIPVFGKVAQLKLYV